MLRKKFNNYQTGTLNYEEYNNKDSAIYTFAIDEK
tara:strand:- start:7 stop:111 length:105 start_codon:yes stop_codon:yes gene_type:complete